MSYFPDPFIHQLSLYLSLDDIMTLGLTNSRFHERIYKNNYIWKSRFINEFGITNLVIPEKEIVDIVTFDGDWKKLYEVTFQVFIVGWPTKSDIREKAPTNNIIYKQIKMSQSHILFLDINDNVYSYGENKYGELGLGDTIKRSVPVTIPKFKAKKISTGLFRSALIDMNNEIWIFGLRSTGLGGFYDDKICNLLPEKIENIKAKDIDIDRFGLLIIDFNDNIWFSNHINILSQIKGIKGKSVAVGDNHAAIIDIDNNLWMFGDVTDGKLGLPINIPDYQDYLYEEYLEIISELNKEYTNPTLLNNIKAKSIVLGHYDTAIIDLDDNVLMWGAILSTKIPQLIPNIKAKQIALGYSHCSILDFDGNVFGLGYGKWEHSGLKSEKVYMKEPTLIPGIKARDICVGSYSSGIIGFKNNIQ